MGGAFGALAVGVLAKAGITGDVNGLLFGNPIQLGYQAVSVLAAGAYSFAATFVILKLVDQFIGLRVSAAEEEAGLDLTQHGERGYITGTDELAGDRARFGTALGFTASAPDEEPSSPSSPLTAEPYPSGH